MLEQGPAWSSACRRTGSQAPACSSAGKGTGATFQGREAKGSQATQHQNPTLLAAGTSHLNLRKPHQLRAHMPWLQVMAASSRTKCMPT